MDRPLVLTQAQAAEVLACSVSAVKKMVADGRLPTVDYSGQRICRIPVAAVEALVADATAKVDGQRARLEVVA